MTTTCPHITSISKKGLDLIKQFEGFRSKPYLDTARIATIGYGTIRYENGVRVTMNDKAISEGRAESLLRTFVARFEKDVDAMTTDKVNQAQFDALVSMCYNIGPTAMKGSTLLRKVNANPSDPGIRAEFGKWVNSGGKRTAGLVTRRKLEADLYFS